MFETGPPTQTDGPLFGPTSLPNGTAPIAVQRECRIRSSRPVAIQPTTISHGLPAATDGGLLAAMNWTGRMPSGTSRWHGSPAKACVRVILRCGLRPGLAAFLLCMAPLGLAQGPTERVEQASHAAALRATEILDRTLDRTEQQKESKIELAFECVVDTIVERLDEAGGITDTEAERFLRYPLEGYLYKELVERGGEPIPPRQAQKERRKRAEFARKARAHAARGERLEAEERTVVFDRKLMARYRTRLAGSEELPVGACWVLHFEPREGRLPRNGPMDRALNQTSGRLWILKSNAQIARVEFGMNSAVRYAWGLFATLRKADGRMEFAEVEEGLWMPSRFRIEIDLQLLMGAKTFRNRIRSRWTNYRRVDATIRSPFSD